jgi:uncharacterized protein
LANLDGKKVGVGPAKGPAEMFFRAAAEVAKIKPIIVNGDPAALSRSLISGEIDALWQGAVVPIPSLVEVADHADAIVFGLSDAEVAAMLRKLPQLAATTISAGTYPPTSEAFRRGISWSPTRIFLLIPPMRSPGRCCRRPIRNRKSIPLPRAHWPVMQSITG